MPFKTSATAPLLSYAISPFLRRRAIHLLPLLQHYSSCRTHGTQSFARRRCPPFLMTNCKKTSFSPFQTFFSFLESSYSSPPTSQSQERAFLATHSFKPLTAATLIWIQPSHLSKHWKQHFSTSKPQKQRYSNKATATPRTSADEDVLFTLLLQQLHPAPFSSVLHFQVPFSFLKNSCLTTPTKRWPSSIMMTIPPSTKSSSVLDLPAPQYSKARSLPWPDSAPEPAPS